MKKLFFAFSALALMTACSQDESVEAIQGTEENALREYTLTAMMPEADTRTYVNELKAYWNADDVIEVKTDDGTKSATLTIKKIDDTDGGKATFSGKINFTPTKAVYSALNKNSYSFSYTGTDSYMRSNSPMEGTIVNDETNGNSVEFSHTAAMIRFTINDVPAGEGGEVNLNCDDIEYSNYVCFSNDSGSKVDIVLDFPIPAGQNTYSVTYNTTEAKTTGSMSFKTPASLTAGQILSLMAENYEDLFTSEYELNTSMNPWELSSDEEERL